MRYELSDYEWAAIKPMLPDEPRGVPSVNDRRVLNGIFSTRSSNVGVSRPEYDKLSAQRSGVHQARINPHLAAR